MSQPKSYSGVYLILSLKWSDGKDHLVWWCSNNTGYTPDVDAAGRYTAAQVAAQPGYYDNDDTTRAVPLYDVMEGLVGPLRRIVATTYRRPSKSYDCHVCGIEQKTHPEASPLTCCNCGGYLCDVCYDENRCSETESQRGRFSFEETGT